MGVWMPGSSWALEAWLPGVGGWTPEFPAGIGVPHLLEDHDITRVLIITKGEGAQPGHLHHVMPAGEGN